MRLPGTHGYTFPWDPPYFGIPDSVLADLANRLCDILLGIAEDHGTAVARSRQSSPTGSIPPEESMDQSYVDDFL